MTDLLSRLTQPAPISDAIARITADAVAGANPDHKSSILLALDDDLNLRIVGAVRAGEHLTLADSFEREADGDIRNVTMVRLSW